MALHVIHAEVEQDRHVLGLFHALCDGLLVERLRQLDHRLERGLAHAVSREVAHDRAADLQELYRQVANLVERREVGAEVVHGEAATEFLDRLDEGLGLGVVGDDGILVGLEHHRIRFDLQLLQAIHQQHQQFGILEGIRRQVDEQARRAALTLELSKRAQRLVHHPAVDGRGQARGFRRRHELAGLDGLVVRTGKAQQHLEHLGRFAVQVDDGLVGKMKLVLLERRPQAPGPSLDRRRIERHLHRAGHGYLGRRRGGFFAAPACFARLKAVAITDWMLAEFRSMTARPQAQLQA